MKDLPLLEVNKRHLGVICLGIIVIILFAGLWPKTFHTRNDVAFLPDGNGIRFDRRGIIFTKDPLVKQQALSEPGSFSIEMVIRSNRELEKKVPVILAFYDGRPCERLIVVQWNSTLIVQTRLRNSCQYDRKRQIGIGDALPAGKSRFIGITSGKRGTAVYIDGQLKEWRRDVSLLDPDENISGRLIIGNSVDGKRPWTGIVSTLAIYDQALSSEEIVQNYEAWRETGRFSPTEHSSPITYYYFDERVGTIVKDHSGQGNDLIVPDRFTPLHRRLLISPWQDFRASRSYVMDIAINILGFVPFGFYIAWYLSERGLSSLRVVIIVFFLGFITSLFIEIIQAYLPARSSQLLDIITNTGGTALGVFLWRHYIFPSHLPKRVD